MKYVLSQQYKHQNKVIDIVLVSLLLTLNIFHNFFLLFLLLNLKRSLLAGNDSSNCYIFMLIIVTHKMAIMSLQTHIIHWKKLKKLIAKCFPKLIIWNKILQKIVWLWWKLIVFLNTHFLCKNYAVHNINIKARIRIIIPSLY